MSATRAPIQNLDQAIERIEALEDALEQGFEYLTPSVYSLNEKGEIEAKITGILEAAGINFKEGTAAGLTTSEIRWLFGAIAETIIGAYRIGEVHHLGIFTQPTGADFAQLSLTAGPTLSKAVFGATSESSPCLIELQINAEGKAEATLRAGAAEINLLEPGATYTGEGAIEITAGHVVKVKPEGIEYSMLKLNCVEASRFPATNSINWQPESIPELAYAELSIPGTSIRSESLTGGEGGKLEANTVTNFNIAEHTIEGSRIKKLTLIGELAALPAAALKWAAEGAAEAKAGGAPGIPEGQRFSITGNGVQTTWKCKHKLGGEGAGLTRYIHVGGVWAQNAAEEPTEALGITSKVVINSSSEVEVVFSGAPAKGEKITFDLITV